MNERIRELAEQARAEVRAEWDKGNKIPYPEAHLAFQRDNDQKFAELIVRECADAIELNTMQIPKRSISEIRTILDKHFGVEA
jgi:uncharacterized protein (DUF305 family)